MTALLAGFGVGFIVSTQHGPRLLKTLDAAAGTVVVGFGGLLAWRTLREGS